MKTRSIIFLALAALMLSVFAGCAQDSTDTTQVAPQKQEEVAKEKSGSASTNTTRKSSEESSGGTEGSKLALAADPSGALKYEPTKLNAEAGKVTIALTNESAVPHDVAVANKSGKVLGKSKEVTKASTDLVIKNLDAGSYRFYCTVPGHEQAGMVGTLTVR
jgi:uncharacterized cupredoxin-like copper-binding protein